MWEGFWKSWVFQLFLGFEPGVKRAGVLDNESGNDDNDELA